MDKLKVIKGIIIFLTSLIIFGIGAVAFGLATKDSKSVKSTISDASSAAVPTTFLNETVASSVKAVSACGSNICAVISDGGLPDRIYIVNDKGYIVRKILLTAKEKAELNPPLQ